VAHRFLVPFCRAPGTTPKGDLAGAPSLRLPYLSISGVNPPGRAELVVNRTKRPRFGSDSLVRTRLARSGTLKRVPSDEAAPACRPRGVLYVRLRAPANPMGPLQHPAVRPRSRRVCRASPSPHHVRRRRRNRLRRAAGPPRGLRAEGSARPWGCRADGR